MEISSRTTNHSQPRLDSSFPRPCLRSSRTPQRLLLLKAATSGDYDNNSSEQKSAAGSNSRSSKKKLGIVTGLLREGYGVGAIVTAAAFRGASLTSDILKGLYEGSRSAVDRHKIRRIPKSRKNELNLMQKVERTISELIMASPAVWDSPKPVLKAEEHLEDNENEIRGEMTFVSAEESMPLNPQDEQHSFQAEGGEQDHMTDLKHTLGIPDEEKISSNHISEDHLTPSAFVSAAEGWMLSGSDFTKEDQDDLESDIQEFREVTEEYKHQTELEKQETAIEEDTPEEETLPVSLEESVLDDLQPPSYGATEDHTLEQEYPYEVEIDFEEQMGSTEKKEEAQPVVAFNKAMEILDEISNFEMESKDTYDEEEEPPVEDTTTVEELPEKPQDSYEVVEESQGSRVEMEEEARDSYDDESQTPRAEVEEEPQDSYEVAEESQTPRAEVEEEPQDFYKVAEESRRSRAEMEEELRLQMRMETERRLRAMRIQNQSNRPEPQIKVQRHSDEEVDSMLPAESPSQVFKGLDYIKSYARETKEEMSEHSDSTESSSFFKPPSVLEATKKSHDIKSSNGYNQTNEIDRLKRVREIGTVMWTGGGDIGGNGGFGGGGGGGSGGGSGDSNQWWFQVGVSMVTMTVLVYVLLSAISTDLEKKKPRRQGRWR